VSDVIEVIEGPIAPMYCLDPHEDEECSSSHHCGLQELWIRVEHAMREVFEHTTVDELVRRHRELQPLLWPTMIGRRATADRPVR
jgi:DNA-binding IscR family transcriptional regulator